MTKQNDPVEEVLDILTEAMQDWLTTGAGLIAVERKRQVSEEGFSADHDTEHTDEALARAGQAYLQFGIMVARISRLGGGASLVEAVLGDPPPSMWPMGWAWKPSPDPIRNLVKAGALIAAEIDRLQQ